MDSRLDLAWGTKDRCGANKGQFGVRDPDRRPAWQDAILRHYNAPRLGSGGQFKRLGAFGIGQFIRSGSSQCRHLVDFSRLLSVQYSP
jgi:hypothetical protein